MGLLTYKCKLIYWGMTLTTAPTQSPKCDLAIAVQYRALADATRLRVLLALAGREVCVCELVEELEVPQPLLSFHLRTLRDAGLVRAERRGRWNYYALEAAGLESTQGFLSDLIATDGAAATRITCCG